MSATAATEPELPPPQSGLFLEVSFRRLLASCEGVVNGSDGAAATTAPSSVLAMRPELARDWATSPVFHHYVETLQEQLADLEGAAPAKRPSAQVLAAYKRRADALSARLRPPAAPPSYVMALAGQGKGSGGAAAGGGGAVASTTRAANDAAAAAAGGSGANDDDGENGETRQQQQQHEARRSELLGASSSAAFGPAVPPAMRRAAPPASLKGLAPRTAAEVETQRGLQETLTDDLVGLARQLRANAEAAGRAVDEREKLLRVAEAELDGAVDGAKRSAAEVKAVYFANRRGFWATLMTFLTVGAVFSATFVYIRATSLLGFSSRRAAAAAARRAAARAERASTSASSSSASAKAAAAKKAAAEPAAAAAATEGGGGETTAATTEAPAAAAATAERATPDAFAEAAPEAAAAAAIEQPEANVAADHTEL